MKRTEEQRRDLIIQSLFREDGSVHTAKLAVMMGRPVANRLSGLIEGMILGKLYKMLEYETDKELGLFLEPQDNGPTIEDWLLNTSKEDVDAFMDSVAEEIMDKFTKRV